MAVLVALLLAALGSEARAETVHCTDVNALPAGPSGSRTIGTPGVYCLTANLRYDGTAGNAVTIAADSVVFDLNGYEVKGSSAVGTIGIYALTRKNLVIRNGTVEGFEHGIVLASGTPNRAEANLIENMQIMRCLASGINVHGFGSTVRRNYVYVFGSSVSPPQDVWGIGLLGSGHRVIDNDLQVGGYGRTQSRAMWVNHCSNVVVVNNRITSSTYGVLFDASTGVIRDNLTYYVEYPYLAISGWGYVDAGNNH
jgi:hypothetical protein